MATGQGTQTEGTGRRTGRARSEEITARMCARDGREGREFTLRFVGV